MADQDAAFRPEGARSPTHVEPSTNCCPRGRGIVRSSPPTQALQLVLNAIAEALAALMDGLGPQEPEADKAGLRQAVGLEDRESRG
jgi:hypothetical protein